MQVTDQDKQKVRKLLIADRKVDAIRFLREKFGLSLADARRMAEAIDSHIEAHEYHKTIQHTASNGSHVSPKKKQAGASVAGLIFGLVGLGLLLGALFSFFNQKEFMESAVTVEGVVVSEPSQPLFEYEYEGQIHSFRSSVSSEPPSYYVGEKVVIFVNPEDPTDIMIDTFIDRYLFMIILGGMGSVFFMIGLGAFFAMKKSANY